uniref:UDP-N-acetylglucosamine diphosphorylase n=1 Tax=viral metagenome TaxID=1070528 RepID=A0A6C0BTH1_9ZZZZ
MNTIIEKQKIIIIMAGGNGTRMKSSLPKVLHKVDGIPMIVKIIHEALLLSPRKIFIVVGRHRLLIENNIKEHIDITNIHFVDQLNPLGTGHAIMTCRKYLIKYNYSDVLILSGDVPCITSNTMNKMFRNMHKCKIAVFEKENPHGYGRIITKNSKFVKIVEELDASNEEKKVNIVNCGLYCFDSVTLCKYLPFLKNNNKKGEYYLTDIIEIIKKYEQINIDMYNIPLVKYIEVTGVNTPEELSEINKYVETLKLAY